ncbi:MAG: FAD-dependent oxidoreductase [Deltaproteobacteria bacterium]
MRYLIIGSSAAGIAAAEAVRSRDPSGSVLVLSDEPHPSYYRPLITALLDNGLGHDSLLRPPAAMPEGIELRLETRVEWFTRRNKTVTLARCASLALRKRGLDLAVVEQQDRLVPLQFDRIAAGIVSRAVQAEGIQLVLNRTVHKVEHENGRLNSVVLSDESRLAADLIVLAVGITPNAELAGEAGLFVNKGVVVDSHMQTRDPDVFAAGDMTETTDIATGESIIAGTWTDAVAMGRVAGINMAGGNAEYGGSLAVQNSFELAGVPTVSVGLVDPSAENGFEVCSLQRGNAYRKLVLKDGCLVGALLVNDIEGAGVYTGLIKRKVRVEPFLEDLMTRRPSYAPWLRTDLSIPPEK